MSKVTRDKVDLIYSYMGYGLIDGSAGSKGSHGEMCVESLVSFAMEDKEFSDSPSCVDLSLSVFGVVINDRYLSREVLVRVFPHSILRKNGITSKSRYESAIKKKRASELRDYAIAQLGSKSLMSRDDSYLKKEKKSHAAINENMLNFIGLRCLCQSYIGVDRVEDIGFVNSLISKINDCQEVFVNYYKGEVDQFMSLRLIINHQQDINQMILDKMNSKKITDALMKIKGRDKFSQLSFEDFLILYFYRNGVSDMIKMGNEYNIISYKIISDASLRTTANDLFLDGYQLREFYLPLIRKQISECVELLKQIGTEGSKYL